MLDYVNTVSLTFDEGMLEIFTYLYAWIFCFFVQENVFAAKTPTIIGVRDCFHSYIVVASQCHSFSGKLIPSSY